MTPGRDNIYEDMTVISRFYSAHHDAYVVNAIPDWQFLELISKIMSSENPIWKPSFNLGGDSQYLSSQIRWFCQLKLKHVLKAHIDSDHSNVYFAWEWRIMINIGPGEEDNV